MSGRDSSGLPEILFPADVSGSTRPDFIGMQLDYVVASPDAAELMRIPLRFERSWATHAAVDVWGFDAEKALAVHVRVERNGTWTLDMRAAEDPLTASQARLLLDLLRLLVPPNSFALTGAGTEPDGFTLLERPAGPPLPPELEGLYAVIENLAALESYVGKPITGPETFSGRSVEDLQVAAELLRGEAVQGTWDGLKWPVTVAQARELASGPLSEGAVDVDITRPWTVDLGDGRRYDVGPVTAHLHSARIATWPKMDDLPDDDSVDLELEPADDHRGIDMRLSLARRYVATPPNQVMATDDPLTLVSAEAFEELLSSLDETSEPAPALARAAARLREMRK